MNRHQHHLHNIHTHTHPLNGPFSGTTQVPAGTRKVKPIWISLKQETVSGSGISWAICKSVSRSRQITTPVPHHSKFSQAGCPSCRPTNSVKALKAYQLHKQRQTYPTPSAIFHQNRLTDSRLHNERYLSQVTCMHTLS